MTVAAGSRATLPGQQTSEPKEQPMPSRRDVVVAGLALAFVTETAAAHHGWAWAENEEFSLTGVVRAARLGNPHGELDVEAADGLWTAEIGQPWRNARAGLTEADLATGTEVTLEGHRSRDPDARLMKAERVIIAGTLYDLYPGRS
jgi:Family of unknown function (DUF6152)